MFTVGVFVAGHRNISVFVRTKGGNGEPSPADCAGRYYIFSIILGFVRARMQVCPLAQFVGAIADDDPNGFGSGDEVVRVLLQNCNTAIDKHVRIDAATTASAATTGTTEVTQSTSAEHKSNFVCAKIDDTDDRVVEQSPPDVQLYVLRCTLLALSLIHI